MRRRGGGRKPLTEIDPTLLRIWSGWSMPIAGVIPESLLLWTSKSVGISLTGCASWAMRCTSRRSRSCCAGLGYSLQANVKTREGAQHPDRDAQFRHINTVATRAVARPSR